MVIPPLEKRVVSFTDTTSKLTVRAKNAQPKAIFQIDRQMDFSLGKLSDWKHSPRVSGLGSSPLSPPSPWMGFALLQRLRRVQQFLLVLLVLSIVPYFSKILLGQLLHADVFRSSLLHANLLRSNLLRADLFRSYLL